MFTLVISVTTIATISLWPFHWKVPMTSVSMAQFNFESQCKAAAEDIARDFSSPDVTFKAKCIYIR